MYIITKQSDHSLRDKFLCKMEEQHRLVPSIAKYGPLSAKDIEAAAMPCYIGYDYPGIGMSGSINTRFSFGY